MPKKQEESAIPRTMDHSVLAKEKEKKKLREEILTLLGTREFFAEGSITIDRRICHGIECRLCIKACPTNAIFWKSGEIGLAEELCIYCGACVLSCIVDDCIKVTRKRQTGEIETFSKPKDFIAEQDNINTRKRLRKIREVFSESEDHHKTSRKK